MHKTCIAGNHDVALTEPKVNVAFANSKNFTYLEDSSVSVEGKTFYGTPWTPTFGGWPGMRDRGPALRRTWGAIPDDIDILVTHGPPQGILDITEDRETHAGCADLAYHVRRARPALHLFGHIHTGYGHRTEGNTHYVNASATRPLTRTLNPPVVLDL